MTVSELLYNVKIEHRAGREPLPLEIFREIYSKANIKLQESLPAIYHRDK